MILAWIFSLLLLCTSLIRHMNDMTALRIIEIETLRDAQEQFITAEQAVLACEKNFHEWQALDDKPGFIQSSGKNAGGLSVKILPKLKYRFLSIPHRDRFND